MTAIDIAEPSLTELVSSARQGDQEAWERLIARYQPLVRSVAWGFRLSAADVDDVCQTVWLKLVEHLGQLREPQALPGWLTVTTANAALAQSKVLARTVAMDPIAPAETRSGMQWLLGSTPEAGHPDEGLLLKETRQEVRDGLADLSPANRELLLMLVADPPLSYKQIGRRAGIPVGSIGPTRRRCLSKLRDTKAVRQAVCELDAPPPAA